MKQSNWKVEDSWGLKEFILLSSAIFTIAHIPTYHTMPVNFFSAIIFH